jgi:hypothetical protein
MTRVAAALTALLVFAGCSSGGSSKPSSAVTSTTSDAGDRGAYADAIYASLVAETPSVPEDDMRCVAEAIVDGVGVDRLHAAGVTVAQARRPDFEPPEAIAQSMNTRQRVEMATRLQACGIGRIVGVSVAGSFASLKGPSGARAQQCFARGFAGAPARRMIAGLMLNDVSIPDAGQLARLTVECVGLAPLIANASSLTLSAAEAQCIERAGRTDTTFLRLLADEFRDMPSSAKTAPARLGAQVFLCLTPAHRAAVAQGS